MSGWLISSRRISRRCLQSRFTSLSTAPVSVFDRSFLMVSLNQLVRFADASRHGVVALRLAYPTRHAFTVGTALVAPGSVHLVQGDWARHAH
jgi:hypothetical protein